MVSNKDDYWHADPVLGTAEVTNKIDKRVIFNALKSWKFWILVPWYTLYAIPVTNNVQFGVYLKANGYSVTMRNIMPTFGNIITAVTLLTYAYLSDRTAKYGRVYVIGAVCVWGVFSSAVLAIYPASNALRVAGFLTNYSTYVTPIFFAWVAEICHGATEERAFITGAISCLWYT
jgi:ACS family pantothenate transporter-like MFS transporter